MTALTVESAAVTAPGPVTASVLAALAAADFDALPDPVLTWVTTTIAHTHPAKTYHFSSRCTALAKVKRPQQVRLTHGAVGRRACAHCVPGPRDQNAQERTALAAHALRTAREDLLAAAGDVDAGVSATSTTRAVRAAQGRVTRGLRGVESAHEQAAGALRDALYVLRQQLVAVYGGDQRSAALERYAAAALLSRQMRPSGSGPAPETVYSPVSARDLNALPGHIRLNNGSATTALNGAFSTFLHRIREGVPEDLARDAAATKALLALDKPREVSQLPATIAVAEGQREVTLADLITQWRAHVETLVADVTQDWVDLARTEADRHAGLGELTIRFNRSTGGSRGFDTELAKFDGAYPEPAAPGAFLALTVPAVVAAWLERRARELAWSVTLVPAGDNTADVLTTVARLRSPASGGVLPDLATALAAARGIHTPVGG